MSDKKHTGLRGIVFSTWNQVVQALRVVVFGFDGSDYHQLRTDTSGRLDTNEAPVTLSTAPESDDALASSAGSTWGLLVANGQGAGNVTWGVFVCSGSDKLLDIGYGPNSGSVTQLVRMGTRGVFIGVDVGTDSLYFKYVDSQPTEGDVAATIYHR